jgi:membrane-associated protease RseP (regulator of RpoE activity)
MSALVRPTPSSRPVHWLLMAGALLAALAPALDAQSSESRRRGERGWIGVSFEVIGDRRGGTYFEIMEVRSGSPAEAAGLRRGDRVLAINELDSPQELATLTERLDLRSGDRVVMDILRDGRRRRVRLEAATRPDDFETGRTVRLSVESDSMIESWVRAMDSLKVELVTGEGGDIRVRGAGARVGREDEARFRVTVGQDQERRGVTVVAEGTGNGVRAPFEFFVFRGEAHDSLRQEMVELNHLVSEIEHRIETRERELRGVFGSVAGDRLHEDMELHRLQQRLDAASTRSAGLEVAMAEAARATAGLDYAERMPGASERATLERVYRSDSGFSPLTPYLLGRNRVAGAEVIDLRPELARYFDVDGGVLVVDVAPGTPASLSGIVPGDVITRLDRVVVRSVEDLRFGVSMADETLPVTLIREGSSVQVLLRR